MTASGFRESCAQSHTTVHRCVLSTVQGFEWKDEGKNGRHKWGYVSWSAGDTIVLKVCKWPASDVL